MIRFRKVNSTDIDIIYNWSNDPEIRQLSYNSDSIIYEDHVRWFNARLLDTSTFFYLFFNEENETIGFVRIEKKDEEFIIGLLIDKKHRGKLYSPQMLVMAIDDFKSVHPSEEVHAYIKSYNMASIKSFTKAGFTNPQEIIIHNIPSIMLNKN
jgi:RimJ/RimL family protein N-acetyltransferase